MTSHPTGVTVEIVGIEASNNGRSCEEHNVCGSVLCDDVIVRLRLVQIIYQDQGKEEETETAIAAYWVSDGHLLISTADKHYDGALAQITEIHCKDSESPSK